LILTQHTIRIAVRPIPMTPDMWALVDMIAEHIANYTGITDTNHHLWSGTIRGPYGPQEIEVIFNAKDHYAPMPEYNVPSGVASWPDDTGKVTVWVSFSVPLGNEEELQIVRQMLVHELTHAVDPKHHNLKLRGPDTGGRLYPKDKTDLYLQSEGEENSFTNENYVRIQQLLDQGYSRQQVKDWIRNYYPSQNYSNPEVLDLYNRPWFENQIVNDPERWRQYKANMYRILNTLLEERVS
jgi:hypothetical protein